MSPPYAPYNDPARDTIYNLLFCDALEDFKNLAPHFPALFAKDIDEAAVRAIADGAAQESRIRYLAFKLLCDELADVPKGQVLGVIVEVALEQGLDTLAAYADGRVRYINQGGGMTIVEQEDSPLRAKALALIEKAGPLVAQIGPWNGARRPPPENNLARLTFLVSDGLYFGEAPLHMLAQDAMAAPVVEAAVALLTATVELSVPGDASQAGR